MIFGNDDRIKIPAYLSPSTGSYVQIRSTYADGYRTQSSGVMIGASDVLTAAHAIYDPAHGGYASNTTVTPSKFGDTAPYGSSYANRLFVNDSWQSSASPFSDYGVISLADPLGYKSGWLGYDAVAPISGLVGRTLTSYGYPSDRDNGKWLYSTSGTLDDIFNNYMLVFSDDLDTYYGQSGSPVIFGDTVIGLVTSQSVSHNYALSLNSYSTEEITAWTSQNDHLLSSTAIKLTLAESITALYIAFFSRAPDQKGLNFWLQSASSLAHQNDITKTVAAMFATEEVFTSTYAPLDNRTYIEAIYKNMLGNPGDESGVTFWANRLDAGYSRACIVDDIVQSAIAAPLQSEAFAHLTYAQYIQASKAQESLRNKLDVSLYYTNQLQSQTDLTYTKALESDPSYIASHAILQNITDDYTTVLAAKAYIEQIHVWLH